MSSRMKINNYILDFVIAHVLSIEYSSTASVRMIKGEAYSDSDFMSMPVPPAAALYEKAINRNGSLESISGNDETSLKATGYSVQVLSKLYDGLKAHGSDIMPSVFLKEISSIALLQLQYAVEYIEESFSSISDITAVLDGGITFVKGSIGSTVVNSSDVISGINNLYNKLAAMLNLDGSSTMDLAHGAKSLALRNSLYRNSQHGSLFGNALRDTPYNSNSQRDSLLTSIVLELLNRKNSIGLFYGSNDTSISLSLGKQFFILDALLLSYPYVMLDNVLDEIFSFFTGLYNIAYKEGHKLFTFQRKNIYYSPFDLGAIHSALYNISKYPLEDTQMEIIESIRETYLNLIMDSYNIQSQGIKNRIRRWREISVRRGINSSASTLFNNAVFPKRIKVTNLPSNKSYRSNGIINQTNLLFLCMSLLNVVEVKSESDNELSEGEVDFSALHLIRTLFDLFS